MVAARWLNDALPVDVASSIASRNRSGLNRLLTRWTRRDSLAKELSLAASDAQRAERSIDRDASNIPMLGETRARQEKSDDFPKIVSRNRLILSALHLRLMRMAWHHHPDTGHLAIRHLSKEWRDFDKKQHSYANPRIGGSGDQLLGWCWGRKYH